MADVHKKSVRSYNMSRIGARDTSPELIVRKYLFGMGLRYRLHVKSLAGKPDIVFKKFRVAIFINGCFWHGHSNCKYFSIPKTRSKWWSEKIDGNRLRNKANIFELKQTGWLVIEIWQCQLKSDKREKTLHTLFLEIANSPNIVDFQSISQ